VSTPPPPSLLRRPGVTSTPMTSDFVTTPMVPPDVALSFHQNFASEKKENRRPWFGRREFRYPNIDRSSIFARFACNIKFHSSGSQK